VKYKMIQRDQRNQNLVSGEAGYGWHSCFKNEKWGNTKEREENRGGNLDHRWNIRLQMGYLGIVPDNPKKMKVIWFWHFSSFWAGWGMERWKQNMMSKIQFWYLNVGLDFGFTWGSRDMLGTISFKSLSNTRSVDLKKLKRGSALIWDKHSFSGNSIFTGRAHFTHPRSVIDGRSCSRLRDLSASVHAHPRPLREMAHVKVKRGSKILTCFLLLSRGIETRQKFPDGDVLGWFYGYLYRSHIGARERWREIGARSVYWIVCHKEVTFRRTRT
jgi:hypothetical protein